jgi:hypothetical protein
MRWGSKNAKKKKIKIGGQECLILKLEDQNSEYCKIGGAKNNSA